MDDEGEILGFAALTRNLEPVELSLLYVNPHAQGAGLGSALVSWVKQHCPKGFVLSTLELNTGSRRFYERHGLVQTSGGVNAVIGLPNVSYEWYDA